MFYHIYKRVRSGWKRQYALTSCGIMKQPVLDKLTHNQDTDIFLQLTSTELGLSKGIYISSIKGHPILIRMSGELQCHNLTLHQAYLHESLTVPWHCIELWHEEEQLFLPSIALIPLFCKWNIRCMMDNHDTKCQIVLCYNKLISPQFGCIPYCSGQRYPKTYGPIIGIARMPF